VLLFFIFYITIVGANIPSELLMGFFNKAEVFLLEFFSRLNINVFFKDMLIKGGFRVLGWVVSVMLPPMAIFFPLFTLLEDAGVLPRITYVLDSKFQKAKTSGKQALTICMGFGCNCVGVTGARIIDSKRERLIAVLTNSFTPCNGRFPAIIKIISIFFVSQVQKGSEALSALILSLVIVMSIAITLLISNVLSKTLLRGEKSHYILELPSYRRPQIAKVIARSFINRTFSVLGRAVAVAFPAGVLIWLLLNFFSEALLSSVMNFLKPVAALMRLDSEILTAFFLGLPANEIVLPICLMLYSGGNELISVESVEAIGKILAENEWTLKTGVCYVLFSVFHFPCATALLTIYKETKSLKWLVVSFFLPTILGVILCVAFNLFFTFFNM
jgi:ferrous iron transport protein B